VRDRAAYVGGLAAWRPPPSGEDAPASTSLTFSFAVNFRYLRLSLNACSLPVERPMLESAPDEICASPYGLGSDPVRTPSTVNALPGEQAKSWQRARARSGARARGDRPGRPSLSVECSLRSRRPAEDVAVSEGRRAVGLGRRGWHGAPRLDRKPVCINCRAVGRIAHVVPDAAPIRVRRDCVYVIAEELIVRLLDALWDMLPKGRGGSSALAPRRLATRSELVAGGGASDRSPNQPAPTQRERRKHVLATVAPLIRRESGSVARPFLRKAPDPHVIRPPSKPILLPRC
jgi:hypothetical protein